MTISSENEAMIVSIVKEIDAIRDNPSLTDEQKEVQIAAKDAEIVALKGGEKRRISGYGSVGGG